VSLGVLALITPEAGQARHGAQLPRAGALTTGDVQRSLKAGFRVARSAGSPLGQSYLTVQTLEFGFAPALICIERQSLGDHTERRVAPPSYRHSARQSSEVVGNYELVPFGPIITHALPDFGQRLIAACSQVAIRQGALGLCRDDTVGDAMLAR
jgi:hypothetical protein